MKKVQSVILMLLVIFVLQSTTMVFARDLDSLSQSNESSASDVSNSDSSSLGDASYDSITDYMSGYSYTTDEQMESASVYASPITNMIGIITGFVVMITVALVGLVTALDLLYIAVPFTRSFLNPMQAQAGGSPMGGMNMMGSMGMGRMGGMAQGGGAGGEYGLHRKWVSDEAVACVNMANAQSQPQGGMGMGMGSMGMNMMGGMGGAQPQPQNTRSVISTYLKKRVVFLVVFAIALTLLLSSLFTDCGLNLAKLLYKIVTKFNETIGNANI